jgi:hypothetical protein
MTFIYLNPLQLDLFCVVVRFTSFYNFFNTMINKRCKKHQFAAHKVLMTSCRAINVLNCVIFAAFDCLKFVFVENVEVCKWQISTSFSFFSQKLYHHQEKKPSRP